jgi:hypothetical protein
MEFHSCHVDAVTVESLRSRSGITGGSTTAVISKYNRDAATYIVTTGPGGPMVPMGKVRKHNIHKN